MKIWTLLTPRSLFGRNLLLMAALILVAELGVGLVLRQFVREQRLAAMGESITVRTEMLSAALRNMTAEQRQGYLNGLEKSGVLVASGKPQVIAETRRPLVKAILRQLSGHLGAQYRLEWQESPEQRLWIGTQIEGQTYWFGLNSGTLFSNRGLSFLGVMLVTGLVALFGAILIQRRINWPLRLLAEAAAKVGSGQQAPVDIPEAPVEIAQLAASFNQMSADLETADRDRALMLAGVSHDLRTPLAKLRLAAEIMANDDKPDAELIAGMIRNIAVADAIVGQFIDFARQGDDEAVSLCDINEMARDVVATAAGKVQLELSGVSPLLCRPVALRRAIANLIDNALRYSPEDRGNVILRTQQRGNTIQIAVLDQGPGIPEDQLARIRQPFVRLEAARGGKPGSGLGLAIVERIVRQHHGELLIENRPEGGLMVTLVLSGER
ncbi:MAG: periplasmic sensory histidine protein kinase [Proteobacteria bacterium]|nr:periplasmic sensory histidine protein kinase [Pseudomonadota bacterium]